MPSLHAADDPAVLVIQDTDAWGVEMAVFINTNFGILCSVINSSQIGSTNFGDYDLIVTVSDENDAYYNTLTANVAKFEDFVQHGGVVQYQGATQGDNYSFDIVGGVTVLNDGYSHAEFQNTVQDPSHPIVEGLPPILDGNWANHTVLLNLPGNANVITTTTISVEPTTVEYKFGKGTVIATGMTWEFLYNYGFEAGKMLGNAVKYSLSLAGVKWLAVDPTSGQVPGGGSMDLIVTLDATDLVPGTYLGEITINSNAPANPVVVVPVTLKVTGPPVPVLISSFDASAVEGGIELNWKIFADEEVSGFKIYRDTEGGSVAQVITPANLIAANVRTYTDEDVLGGKTYHYTLAAVLPNGNEITSPVVTAQAKAFELALHQNTPNPFNPTTRIAFTLPHRDQVVLAIYDVHGKLVKTLMDEEVGEGKHELVWDGTDVNGSTVSSGMYFYRLHTGKNTMTRKMLMLK
jgi:hypothetical protein